MSFARPQVTFDPIEIPVYNSRVYLAGRPTWQAVTTTLRDDAGGNVSRLVGEQLQKQFDFMEIIFLFDMSINLEQLLSNL